MGYFLRQTWSNLQASWGIAIQAVLVIGIAFLLLGAFGLLALQVESVLQHWEREAPVIVYLKDGLTPIDRARLMQELQKFQEVKRVQLVSSAQAMRRMRRALGKQGPLLDGLDAPILPTTLEVDLQAWARTPHALGQIQTGFAKLSGVQEVDVGRRWFVPLWTLVQWIRAILWSGSALLLLSSCLIAAGTVRLALFIHRDEISIMRLLGATESFIRLPFYLEGALKGLCAATSALLLLLAVFTFFFSRYNADFFAFTSIPLQFFQPLHIALFLGGGLLSGFVGSWLAFLAAPKTLYER